VRSHRDKRELTERNQRMVCMRRDGMKLREIGAVFGVSEVRVHEICRREKGRQQMEMARG
jgi:DNA-directed RNA polymerase specialized sigma subunit